MKPLSGRQFLDSAIQTALRFPLTMVFAVLSTLASISLSHGRYQQEFNKDLAQWNKVFYIGLLLSISVSLFCERKKFKLPAKLLMMALGVLITLGYYFTIGDVMEAELFNYVLVCISLHLLISFAAFTGKETLSEMWAFNKSIFLRILLAFFYSGVIYIGLSLALLAINKLLGASIDGETYVDLWFIVAGIFNTWFFLAGVPSVQDEFEQKPYPRGLKIFTVNILLPLVVIYMLILYIYTFKIIFNARLVDSAISGLVSTFGFFGILSLLLLYPITNADGHRWVRIFSKSFYFLILPLAVEMLIALNHLLNQEGLMPYAYLQVLLGFWLIFISIYSIIRPAKNLRVIPVSLFIISLLSTFGPWGMIEMSANSQVNRLKMIFEKNKLLKDGKFSEASMKQEIGVDDSYQISRILYRIDDVDGFKELQPLFKMDLDSFARAYSYGDHPAGSLSNYLSERRTNISELNTEGSDTPQSTGEEVRNKTFYYGLIPIAGYNFIGDFHMDASYPEPRQFFIEKDTLTLRYDYQKNCFYINFSKLPQLELNTEEKIKDLFPLPEQISDPEQLSFSAANKKWSVKIVTTQLILDQTTNLSVYSIAGKIMIRIR
jgi:hypothetical protein